MKRYFLPVIVLLLTTTAAIAQDDSPKKKIKEHDEIIIKRKDDNKDAKVTIEIKGDNVIANGKPIDDYVNDEVSVQLRNAYRFRLNPSSQFRNENGNWSMDGDDDLVGERAFLGVSTSGTSGGAKIENVSDNSAAAKAGLKKGDVITKVNGKEVFDQEQLSQLIADMKPDDKVTIDYKRDGKQNTTSATLGKMKRSIARTYRGAPMPPLPPMAFDLEGAGPDMRDFDHVFEFRSKPRLGIKAQDTEDGKGVKVIDVDDGSAADKAGIEEEDLITSFDGKEVNSADQLADASKAAKDKPAIKIGINRNGKTQTIELKVPRKLKTANL